MTIHFIFLVTFLVVALYLLTMTRLYSVWSYYPSNNMVSIDTPISKVRNWFIENIKWWIVPKLKVLSFVQKISSGNFLHINLLFMEIKNWTWNILFPYPKNFPYKTLTGIQWTPCYLTPIRLKKFDPPAFRTPRDLNCELSLTYTKKFKYNYRNFYSHKKITLEVLFKKIKANTSVWIIYL